MSFFLQIRNHSPTLIHLSVVISFGILNHLGLDINSILIEAFLRSFIYELSGKVFHKKQGKHMDFMMVVGRKNVWLSRVRYHDSRD